ncbi:protein N-terminal asparagine amidohydrolase-like [Clytia hemisphaerica]|uniref:Protein N-terminal asparagine amidohydrolase n=1 Tax=Clytia hemisphaerica TaxID=252671 RepID=A0A7M5V1Q7_9CNID|eukprot:TCONS_00023076-protein
MPLLIDGKHIGLSEDCSPVYFFKSNPELAKKSRDFIHEKSSLKKTLCENDRLLFVAQKEYAVLSTNQNQARFDWLASDDATTCHIMILKEPKTLTYGLMHVDGFGETRQDILEMISNMLQCSRLVSENDCSDLEMYLFGGFVDSKCHSEPIFQDVLNICKSVLVNIHLKIACCYSINNETKKELEFPIITGVGVDLRKQQFEIVKCSFQGPDALLRHVRLLYDSNKDGRCRQIYDYTQGLVYIEPFVFRTPSYAYYELMRLPDHVYLKYTSTSPHCEPDHFVESSKNAIKFTLKYHQLIDTIFSNKRREWYLNDENVWCLKDKVHTMLTL